MKLFYITGIILFLCIAVTAIVFGIIYYSFYELERAAKPIFISLKFITPIISIILIFFLIWIVFIKKVPIPGTNIKNNFIAYLLVCLILGVWFTYIGAGYYAAVSTFGINEFNKENIIISDKYFKYESSRSGSYKKYFIKFKIEESDKIKILKIKFSEYDKLEIGKKYKVKFAVSRFGYIFYRKNHFLYSE